MQSMKSHLLQLDRESPSVANLGDMIDFAAIRQLTKRVKLKRP